MIKDRFKENEKVYLDTVRHILERGEKRTTRSGEVLSLFGVHMRFDLQKGFPLLTTKKVNFEAVRDELLWFLKGSTNIHDGLNSGIWDAWADANGDLGPIYGHQWRNWNSEGIDQIRQVISSIKDDPYSRRHIVSAWNPGQINQMALPPCHTFFQFYVHEPYLSIQVYQRSGDFGLGIPFNIASYALLLSMVATECDKVPGHLVHVIGDAHVYENHKDGLEKQLARKVRDAPELVVEKVPFDQMSKEHIHLVEYNPHDAIKLEVSV